jgi:hypothetical protein
VSDQQEPSIDLPSKRLLGHAIPDAERGVPAHLHRQLDPLVAEALNGVQPVVLNMTALRLGLDWDSESVPYHTTVGESLTAKAARRSDAVFLDLMQLALGACKNAEPERAPVLAKAINVVLSISGSAYAVGPDNQTVVHRNDEIAEAAVRAAVEVEDEAGGHLATAWAAAFGLQPNARDAWAAAIRAVEAVLIPFVWPDPTRRGRQHLLQRVTDSVISATRGRCAIPPSTWTRLSR